MKKLSILICAILLIGAVGCGNKSETNEQKNITTTNTSTKKKRNSPYEGVWKEKDSDLPSVELIIKSVKDNKVIFDYEIYQLTSFENVEVTMDNNKGEFNATNVSDWNIKGTIEFKKNKVVFNVNEVSNDNIPKGSTTFTINTDKSIIQGLEY